MIRFHRSVYIIVKTCSGFTEHGQEVGEVLGEKTLAETVLGLAVALVGVEPGGRSEPRHLEHHSAGLIYSGIDPGSFFVEPGGLGDHDGPQEVVAGNGQL